MQAQPLRLREAACTHCQTRTVCGLSIRRPDWADRYRSHRCRLPHTWSAYLAGAHDHASVCSAGRCDVCSCGATACRGSRRRAGDTVAAGRHIRPLCQFCANGAPDIGRGSCARVPVARSSNLVSFAGARSACSACLGIERHCLGSGDGCQVAGAHSHACCVGVILALDRLYYRRSGWLAVIVPGVFAAGCVAAWYAAQMAIVGNGQFQDGASVLREGFWLHIASLDPERWRNALSVLRRTGWWLWGVPAVIWGMYQARQRTAQGFAHATLLTFLIVNLLWFAALSIGWARYAFYFLALTTIPLAGLMLAFWRCVTLPAVARKTTVVLVCLAYVVSRGQTFITTSSPAPALIWRLNTAPIASTGW